MKTTGLTCKQSLEIAYQKHNNIVNGGDLYKGDNLNKDVMPTSFRKFPSLLVCGKTFDIGHNF